MSKKILFPTDFSQASKNAFIYALQLADSIHAEVITLHVYQVPQANFVNAAEYLHEIYDVTELSNFENYKDQVPSLRDIAAANNLSHIKISHILLSGNLVQEIKKITTNEKFDFVVMGTKGGSSLEETFFGTNATKVMSDVNAVVLVIPKDCQYKPIQKMLFLTQYKTEDTLSFQIMLSLAETFNAAVDCLQIVSKEKQNKVNCMEEWKEMTKDKEVAFLTIEGEDTEGLILSFIESHTIDMIAMHVYHKTFFEKLFETSLSKKLAFHINIPVVAIPE
ncbi:universal stress protein [Flavobacterium sp. I-SCBP12n]|uniref:Universal stress protein n=1 Tax=Flavobacterium pygoscelis TaxID=2893176 RepID=A0A9X1XSB5_9FLAO|nr:universal stress protein [Flavobacterium pygoscelis]MCK8142382.1 universal stress protein [Flavobacterium pygoscelis]